MEPPDDAAETSGTVPLQHGFILTAAVLGTLLALTLGAQLPGDLMPHRLAGQRATLALVWPQGWAFFAAQPQQETIAVERVAADGKPGHQVLAPQMSAANTWGLGRMSTVQFDQAYALAALVPADAWSPCADVQSTACLSRKPETALNNTSDPALVCGTYAFIRTQPSAVVPRRGVMAIVKVACP